MSRKELQDFEDPIQPSSTGRLNSARSRRDMLRGKLRQSDIPAIPQPTESPLVKNSKLPLPEKSASANSDELQTVNRRRFLEYGLLATSIIVPAAIGGYVVWRRNEDKPFNLGATKASETATKEAPKTGEFDIDEARKVIGKVVLKVHRGFPDQDDPVGIKELWTRSPQIMETAARESVTIGKMGAQVRRYDDSGLFFTPEEFLIKKASTFWAEFKSKRDNYGYNPASSPVAFRTGSLLDSTAFFSKAMIISSEFMYEPYVSNISSTYVLDGQKRPFSKDEPFSVKKLVEDLLAETVNPKLKEQHKQKALSVSSTDQETIETLRELRAKLNSSKLGPSTYDLFISDFVARMQADIILQNPGLQVLNPLDNDQIIYDGTFNGLLIDETTIAEWHRSRGM